MARGDADGAEAAYRVALRSGIRLSQSRRNELLLLLAVGGAPRSVAAVVDDLRSDRVPPSPAELVARLVSARCAAHGGGGREREGGRVGRERGREGERRRQQQREKERERDLCVKTQLFPPFSLLSLSHRLSSPCRPAPTRAAPWLLDPPCRLPALPLGLWGAARLLLHALAHEPRR